MTDADRVIAALERLQAAVEALPRRIAAEVGSDRRRPSLSAADASRLEGLAPAIYAAWPQLVFTVADLWLDADETKNAELLRALGPRAEAKRLGRLLARAAEADHDAGGFAIHRAARLREGQAWLVKRRAFRGDE